MEPAGIRQAETEVEEVRDEKPAVFRVERLGR